ncbi:uncharacterized protein LOC121112552 [Gallus gallus]|uniref:uncharacterized protein LOC121112552 n=1 Tax=Gallus gallus TaxID=9031 RepID=UPI001F00D7B4|nr:uncharacterized protein LOC121112552 [Gallus gallus]
MSIFPTSFHPNNRSPLTAPLLGANTKRLRVGFTRLRELRTGTDRDKENGSWGLHLHGAGGGGDVGQRSTAFPARNPAAPPSRRRHHGGSGSAAAPPAPRSHWSVRRGGQALRAGAFPSVVAPSLRHHRAHPGWPRPGCPRRCPPPCACFASTAPGRPGPGWGWRRRGRRRRRRRRRRGRRRRRRRKKERRRRAGTWWTSARPSPPCPAPCGPSWRAASCWLPAVFDVYGGIAKEDITDSIKSEVSGDLEDALLAVGLGTDGNTLIRVVVFRFKIDILGIGRELLTMYGKSLYSFIKGDCSGDYRNILLKLCGSEDRRIPGVCPALWEGRDHKDFSQVFVTW